MGVVLILVRKEMEQINGIVSKEYVEGIKKLGISFLSNMEGAYLLGRTDDNGDLLEYFSCVKLPFTVQDSIVRSMNSYDATCIDDLTKKQLAAIRDLAQNSTFLVDKALEKQEEKNGIKGK